MDERNAARLEIDRQRLQHHVSIWPVFAVKFQVVLEAVRGVRQHQLSFWDAQIWAAARLNYVSMVLTEDIGPGAVIRGCTLRGSLRGRFPAARFGGE
jgi:predicted nucleic acid-binding protein